MWEKGPVTLNMSSEEVMNSKKNWFQYSFLKPDDFMFSLVPTLVYSLWIVRFLWKAPYKWCCYVFS